MANEKPNQKKSPSKKKTEKSAFLSKLEGFETEKNEGKKNSVKVHSYQNYEVLNKNEKKNYKPPKKTVGDSKILPDPGLIVKLSSICS